MSITNTQIRNWSDSNGAGLNASVGIASDQEIEASVALINGVKTETLTLLHSNLKSIFLMNDVGVSVVAKDSGGSTVATLVLPANWAWGWMSGDPVASPFGSDVATMVCTAAAQGTLNITLLQTAVS